MTARPCCFSPDSQDNSPSTSLDRPRNGWRNCFSLLDAVVRYLIRRPAIWIPLVLLLVATMIFRFTDWDLIISRPFFVSQGTMSESRSHWPLKVAQPWKSLYEHGVYPAWIIGTGGLVVWVVSFFWSKLKSWRDPGLFFALMLALGPGLLVNGIFKPYWGRPRPHQTIPFAGNKEYLPVGDKGNVFEGASFPSGHASMGFYLMAPAFVLYWRRPRWAAMFLVLGLAGGTIMGAARIVAGSHFASDVVWSAAVVYFTGLGLSALFHFGEKKGSD